MSAALAQAYMGNPDLNQQRAATRASDEGVPRAASGYLPQVAATATLGYNYLDGQQAIQGLSISVPEKASSFPKTFGVGLSQNIFNGYQTKNAVRSAESSVLLAREQIRNTEQTTLQNAATAYMNVLRDTSLLALNRNNITVLEEQVRQTKRRQELGDLTGTDVAQAESSLATAHSNFFTARANLQNSVANFRQLIGAEPKQLQAARPIDDLLPTVLSLALDLALREHPALQAAFHSVDVAELQVHIYEGQLYPTLNFVANLQQNDQYSGIPQNHLLNASALFQLSVPLYAGSDDYAKIRQAKEALAQARLQADVQRDTIRASLVSAWGQLQMSKTRIVSSRLAVRASEIALMGVRNEAKLGHRTTLDVLLAQQNLLNARANLVSAERDHVVASYAVMAAIGKLSAANLSLDVVPYDPSIHFEQVKDKWFGLRTADGH